MVVRTQREGVSASNPSLAPSDVMAGLDPAMTESKLLIQMR